MKPTADLSGKTVLFAHPGSELYGSDRVALESIEGLIAAGANVAVTLPASGPLAAEITKLGADVSICRTPVLRKRMLRPLGLIRLAIDAVGSAVASWGLMRRVRPDLVYVNTLTIPLWIYIGRLRGARVLAHVHEAEGSASRFVGAALTLPLLAAHHVVANSSYSVEVMARSYPSLVRRAEVIYNGVRGPARAVEPRQELDGTVRMLYIGRLSERKGVDVAVEAVSLLRHQGLDASLDIVGAVFPGYEWFETQLRTLIHERDLDEAVILHGFHDDVWTHVAAADVVVVPSRVDEPFGNTAVEALLAGRPVIASDTSGLREAAGGYRSARLVPPSDPMAIADAVQEIATTWTQARSDAWLDRQTADARHDPALYRRRIGWAAQLTLPQAPGRAGGSPSLPSPPATTRDESAERVSPALS